MIGSRLASTETLPKDWTVRNLGQIGSYVNGYPFKPAEWTTQGVPIIRIQNLTDATKPFNYFGGTVEERYRISTGDVLVSWSASLGAFKWTRGPAWLNQHIFKASPRDHIVCAPFFYFLMRHSIERIAKNARGSTMRHVTLKEFVQSEVAIPGMKEQRQIARVLSAVQRSIERQERLIALTAELKKALMHHLFTHGTRGEPLKQTEIGPVPESWEVKRIADVCKLVSGGTPSKGNPAFWNGSIPWASPKDMKQSRLSDAEDHISQAGRDDGSRQAPAGSIFVVIRGMILMRDVPIAQAVVPMAFNQDMKALVEHRGISSDFLLYSLQRARERLLQKVGSSAHGTRTLMTSAVEQLPIGVPKQSEQEAISKAVKLTETKESSHKRTAERLQELFRTLLHQLMTAQIRVHDLDLSALDSVAIEPAADAVEVP